jgi:deoxyribodipyrimidine photolyase
MSMLAAESVTGSRTACFTEAEARDLFVRIMEEWDFAPWRRGEVAVPTWDAISRRLRDAGGVRCSCRHWLC